VLTQAQATRLVTYLKERWPDMPQIVNGVVVPPPAAVAV
jgi:hypothetical protein